MSKVKKLLAVFAMVIVSLAFTGCSASQLAADNIDPACTFIIIANCDGFFVVVHKETKVMYIISNGAYNCGIATVMLRPDGKPLLWKGDD